MASLRVVRRRSLSDVRMIPAKVLPKTNIDTMSLGDVLYRLSLVSPNVYKAFDEFARLRYKQLWPHETDIIALKEFRLASRNSR